MAALHPQIQALIDAEPPPALAPSATELERLRGAYAQTAETLGGPIVPVRRVEHATVSGAGPGAAPVPVRTYVPTQPSSPLGVLVWFHGGGWVIGDIEGFDRVARALCEGSGQAVVSVGYRLAPEHPFPAAVDDAEAALRWAAGPGAARLGVEPGHVVVGGDSAGGQLAALAARRAPGLARAQLLAYPALDPWRSSASYREFADGPMLSDREMELCWAAYLQGADPRAAAPLALGDLDALPPALVVVAGHDPLRDEGLVYAQALREAGVPVRAEVYDDMTHGFLRWGGVVDRAHELIAELAAAARDPERIA